VRRDLLAIVALVASIVTFAIGLREARSASKAQEKQNDRVLVEQLRQQYTRIGVLANKSSSERTGSELYELKADLAVAGGILRSLGNQATPEDFAFVADMYLNAGFPYLSVPYYEPAIAREKEPTLLAQDWWGLAIARIRNQQFAAARTAVARAFPILKASGYPPVALLHILATGERVWTDVDAEARYNHSAPRSVVCPDAKSRGPLRRAQEEARADIRIRTNR